MVRTEGNTDRSSREVPRGPYSSAKDTSVLFNSTGISTGCQNNAAMLEDLEVVFEDSTALTCERPSDAHIHVCTN